MAWNRRHPDDDPGIPDWHEPDSYKEMWELDRQVRNRPESTARQHGYDEGWD